MAAPNNSWCSGVRSVPVRTSWSETSSVSVPGERAKRRFVGMGQALVEHAGRVGATSRHEHSPRVSVAGAPARGPTVGARARTRARPCGHSRAEPPAATRPVVAL